jgi:hypothetical protein
VALFGRVGNKKPTQKKKKTPKITHQKWVFLNFEFFMKIIQTFLLETDFYEQIRRKLSFIYKKIVRYALN